MRGLRLMALLTASAALAARGGAAPQEVAATIHADRPADEAGLPLDGWSLPAPGTPGAARLLANLLQNSSFEGTPRGEALGLPKAWGKPQGWELRSCGPRRLLVRHQRGHKGDDDLLLLARRRQWSAYRLSLLARKIAGPGGLCVLFEVRDRKTHLRWTLGGLGNRYHVLEKVRRGQAERLGPAVVGRIEPGRCYKIEVSRRQRVTRFSLNGRLIHSVKERMPWGGIGLADADATAEYFDLVVYGRHSTQWFGLDHPAESQRSSLAAGWEPLLDPRNDVAYKWDALYPHNSYFCQSIKVRKHVGGDAGIRQRGVPITAGTTYRGRAYLRSEGKAAIAVSLRGRQGQVYAQRVLGEPSDTWKAFDFDLKPNASDRAADFCIRVAASAIVWVDQVSLTPTDAATPYGLRRDLVEALRERKPPILCWPAGSGVGHYDWRSGVGARDLRPVEAVADETLKAVVAAPSDFGTDEFLQLCEAVRAKPVLAINPHLGLRPALYWLDYCNTEANTPMGKRRAENGRVEPYGVTLWAVGGLHWDEWDPDRYAKAVGPIVEAMREEDPSAHVLPLLWQACSVRNLVRVEARPAAQVWIVAARRDDRIVVRAVHLGEREQQVSVAVKGLRAGLRAAAQADHFRVDADSASVAQAKIPVAGNQFRLPVPPRSSHVVVLRLVGEPK